jgi:hypothetical protein
MKSKSAKTDIQILRNAMLFSLTRHAWSNRCKVGNDRLKTDEVDELGAVSTRKVTKRVNATKQLIMCEAYENITNHLNEVYSWCLGRSMMATGISRGVYFVRRDMAEAFEEKLEAANTRLREELVPTFIAQYEKSKEDAKRPVNDSEPEKGGLGSLYNEGDYPTTELLRASFGMEHSWFALSVPDELPEEIRSRENQKLKDQFANAQTEILYALREGFKGLVEHAIERLHVKAGEKPKIFRADGMVEGFMEFFETFGARNLMDDAQLEEVVAQAKDIVQQFAPNIQNVKTSISLRNGVAEQLTGLAITLDALIKDKPSRKFDFTE